MWAATYSYAAMPKARRPLTTVPRSPQPNLFAGVVTIVSGLVGPRPTPLVHHGAMLLYAATSNPGKLRDFAAHADIQPLPGLADIPPPPEDAPTFAENARAKAIFYSLQSPGLPVLADDSGLEIDALHGAPGVRSARFADDRNYVTRRPLPIDQRNNLCVLDALATTRDDDRQARYRCALALAQDGRILAEAEGAVDGEILAIPRGSGGFGYDPLFLLPDLGVTMAELNSEEKLTLSHRGRALKALLAKLDAA